MCDDLFDESGDEKDIQELSWRKTTDGINKDGYRAGIDKGQEEMLQDGFNSTFSASSRLLYTLSTLRGQISGKLSYNLMKPGTYSTDQVNQLETLLKDLLEYETELLNLSNPLYADLESNLPELDKLASLRHSGKDESNSIKSQPSSVDKTSASTDSSTDALLTSNSDIVSDKVTSCDSIVSKITNFKQRFSTVLQSASDR